MTINKKWIGWGTGILLAAAAAILTQYLGVRIPVPPPGPPPDEPIFAMGWVDDQAAVKKVVENLEFKSFAETPPGRAVQGDLPDRVLLWEAQRAILGDILPSRNQGSVGTCVSFGFAGAIETSWLVDISAKKGGRGDFKPVATEPIYALSRVEVGGGRINGDGSVGAWAAKSSADYGNLFREVYGSHDLSQYSESRSREWGRRGLPDDLEPTAKKYVCKQVAPVLTLEELDKSLFNGYAVAVCSRQGFTRERDAAGFAKASGSWAHCMYICGYRTQPRKGYACINSWGDQYHTGPRGEGLSNAGFWIEAPVMARMLGAKDSFAVSGPAGFEVRPVDKLDWFIKANELRAPAALIASATYAPLERTSEWAFLGAVACFGGLGFCIAILLTAPRKGRWALVVGALAVLSSSATAEDDGEAARAKAKAALALALAEEPVQAPSPQPKQPEPENLFIDYSKAYELAAKTNRPVMVHVGGFDCGDACSGEKRLIRTKTASLFGDSTPRMALFSPKLGRVELIEEWLAKPTAAELHRSLQSLNPAPPPTPTLADNNWTIQYAAPTRPQYQYASPSAPQYQSAACSA
jgi:hypothetical protein